MNWRSQSEILTVVDLLDSRGISWAGYFEDQPGPGYMAMGSDGHTGNGGWDYVRKHKCGQGTSRRPAWHAVDNV